MPRIGGRSGPRYRAIVDALDDDTKSGRLKPGMRLPTHRELADRLGVTVGTVSRAYAEAARRGLVSGEVGRGTFVRARGGDPLRFDVPSSGAGLIDLSLNLPPTVEGADPAAAALQTTLATLAAERDLASLLLYPPDGGSPRHREAGAAWMSRVGLEAPPERVLVVAGGHHAITTIFAALLQPGDLVLAEGLTYPGLKAIASLLHLRVQGLPLDEHGLRPEAFEAACRGGARALYCVPTIQNPTGATMPAERRERIAAIARTHGVAIVEDDIHALLPRERPRPIAAHAPDVGYYVLSASKMLTPGLRLGYVLAPASAVERLGAAARTTTWGAPQVMAEVARRWIHDGTAERILETRRREAAARQAIARRVLTAARLTTAPAAYHAWLQLPEDWRGEAFAARARQSGVAVTPAEAFAVSRTAVPQAVRVCLGAPASRAAVERGLTVLQGLLQGATEPAPAIV
jgi:DNA-binding transcriptional MocR family regulator